MCFYLLSFPMIGPQDGYSADRSASATPRNYSSNNENIASATHGYVKKDLNRYGTVYCTVIVCTVCVPSDV